MEGMQEDNPLQRSTQPPQFSQTTAAATIHLPPSLGLVATTTTTAITTSAASEGRTSSDRLLGDDGGEVILAHALSHAKPARAARARTRVGGRVTHAAKYGTRASPMVGVQLEEAPPQLHALPSSAAIDARVHSMTQTVSIMDPVKPRIISLAGVAASTTPPQPSPNEHAQKSVQAKLARTSLEDELAPRRGIKRVSKLLR